MKIELTCSCGAKLVVEWERQDRSHNEELTLRNGAKSMPEVGGSMIDGTLADLERRARLCIGREQEKIAPDNALIAVLCDTVRLVREHCDYVKCHVQNKRMDEWVR